MWDRSGDGERQLRFSYYLRTRFRFYKLRSQCVELVVHGIIGEEDEVFQFYYELCNRFARDGSSLDFKSFLKHVTEAVLLDKVDESDKNIEELLRCVKQRPQEFQLLVSDFYQAIRISLLDSSTTLQISEGLNLIPALKPAGDWLLVSFSACIFVPRVLRHVFVGDYETRQTVKVAYERTRDIKTRWLPA